MCHPDPICRGMNDKLRILTVQFCQSGLGNFHVNQVVLGTGLVLISPETAHSGLDFSLKPMNCRFQRIPFIADIRICCDNPVF
ncbi:hypothetical protein [uncultured Desulfobacter sp.]|uniref:hypothetical protein n=1 Tax=uncultured Desulfobacter sp. TaxID=240139 RepID=UPI002AA8223D|nr:hypothetical protein [uncultured Desulfobacter sp.]